MYIHLTYTAPARTGVYCDNYTESRSVLSRGAACNSGMGQ